MFLLKALKDKEAFILWNYPPSQWDDSNGILTNKNSRLSSDLLHSGISFFFPVVRRFLQLRFIVKTDTINPSYKAFKGILSQTERDKQNRTIILHSGSPFNRMIILCYKTSDLPWLISDPWSSLSISLEHVDQSLLGLVGRLEGGETHVGGEIVSPQGSVTFKI